MAYPTINSPYGFEAINRYDGMPYAGATLQYKISGSYNTPIYNGSSVKIVAGGNIELSGAYVVVDASAAFKVSVTTSGAATVVTGANATIVGANVAEIQNGTGSTTTGNAQSSIVKPADTAGAATTLPWRVVAVVPDTAYVSGGVTLYPEVIVKVNNPQLTALTGVAYTA